MSMKKTDLIPLKKPDSYGVASIFQPMRLTLPHPSPPPLGMGGLED